MIDDDSTVHIYTAHSSIILYVCSSALTNIDELLTFKENKPSCINTDVHTHRHMLNKVTTY